MVSMLEASRGWENEDFILQKRDRTAYSPMPENLDSIGIYAYTGIHIFLSPV